jgi:hypothetical protein
MRRLLPGERNEMGARDAKLPYQPVKYTKKGKTERLLSFRAYGLGIGPLTPRGPQRAGRCIMTTGELCVRLYALAQFVLIAAMGVVMLMMSWERNGEGGPSLMVYPVLLNGFGGMTWLLLDAIFRIGRRHRHEAPR